MARAPFSPGGAWPAKGGVRVIDGIRGRSGRLLVREEEGYGGQYDKATEL